MSKIFLIVIALVFTFNVNSQTICKRIVADFGTFPAGGYQVNGSATLTDSLGNLYLSLSSNFNTLAGPDLYLYLSINDEAPTIPGNTNVEVALMISNVGSQSYLVPGNYTLNDFDYVLIHCKQFDHLWDGGILGSTSCNTATAVVEESQLEKIIIKNNGTEFIRIEVLSPNDNKFWLEVYSASGRLVYSLVKRTNVEFNVEQSLSAGLYFVKIIFDNRTLIEKVVKRE